MKKTAQLSLLETTIKSIGYAIRYEKGNFLGGDCRVREDNVVVVNKFLPLEGKIYTLAQVISKINPPGLLPEAAKIVDSLVNSSLFSKDKRG
ncbi:MAG: hypothetical protein HGA70_00615 [Chlorobiaceae bacterium]|nr:hypothetical protein [Chlorobiaceae bacterium]NTW10023.1 hypothetical protein [Chlorobiaceae bacterium]